MQTFEVDGMTCGHCERSVTGAIHAIDAAATVTIDRAAGIVRVDSHAPAAAVVAGIEAEGYRARSLPSGGSDG